MKELNLENIKKYIGKKTFTAFAYKESENSFMFGFNVYSIISVGVNEEKLTMIVLKPDIPTLQTQVVHSFSSLCFTKKDAIKELLNEKMNDFLSLKRTASKEYKIKL